MRVSQLKIGQKVIVVYPNSNVVRGEVQTWERSTSFESVSLYLPKQKKTSYVDSALIRRDTRMNRLRIFLANIYHHLAEKFESKRYKLLHDIQ